MPKLLPRLVPRLMLKVGASARVGGAKLPHTPLASPPQTPLSPPRGHPPGNGRRGSGPAVVSTGTCAPNGTKACKCNARTQRRTGHGYKADAPACPTSSRPQTPGKYRRGGGLADAAAALRVAVAPRGTALHSCAERSWLRETQAKLRQRTVQSHLAYGETCATHMRRQPMNKCMAHLSPPR